MLVRGWNLCRDARARRREREDVRRSKLDEAYLRRFAAEVRRLYPGSPAGAEETIARHACLRSSGRIGRTAAAQGLDPDAIRLAVVAHIRHAKTPYDELLSRGVDRDDARARVESQLRAVLAEWRAE